MKKFIWLAFVVFFLAFVPMLPSQAPVFAEGDGTPANPYQITDRFQLQQMNNNLNASYILINDIDCSDTVNWNGGAGFVPIGSASSPFTGAFDGQNNKITGLFINTPNTDNVGMFGRTGSDAIIKNVGLVDDKIAGEYSVGGLVGWNFGTITDSYASGSVTNYFSSLGGLVGENSGTITNSYATGRISGSRYVGGLVGYNYGGTITNSYASGSVNSRNNMVGGLIGVNNGAITNSYATGSVAGYSVVGGLVGLNGNDRIGSTYYGGTITSSYATGSVTGYSGVGGLVGNYAMGTITNTYSTGSVSGSMFVGGLVGYLNGVITNSYSTGIVSGINYTGGLVGYKNYGATTNSSYWDTETSGQSASAGGTGKTTIEMKQQATFVDWDFVNIWAIKEGVTYPYFLWQIPPVPVDDIPPVIAAHDDVFAEATSPAGAVVYYVLPTASDNYDTSAIVTCTPASGSTFPLGDTTVTCKAVDAAGNQATPTSFIVHVVDTTPPMIYVSAPECVPYGKGNGNKANKITVTAQDNCSKSVIPLITKVEVFNNGGNLVNGNGIYEISGNTVYITPNGNGWSVRITAFAEDEKGNPRTTQITKYLIKC